MGIVAGGRGNVCMSRVAVVTGVGRLRGIAAAVVRGLARDGWDIAGVFFSGYDDRMPWGRDAQSQSVLARELDGLGRRYLSIEVDLADPDPASVLEQVQAQLGPPQALVVAHTESVTSGLLAVPGAGAAVSRPSRRERGRSGPRLRAHGDR